MRSRFCTKRYRIFPNILIITAFYGGLLGICVGFSIVGFMEIVYYTTYRLLMNIFRPSKRLLSRLFGGIPSYRDIEQVLLANRKAAQRDVRAKMYIQKVLNCKQADVI